MNIIRGVAEGTVYAACFLGFVSLSFEINRRLLLTGLNVFWPGKNFFKDDDDDVIIIMFDESEDDEIEMVEKPPPPYTEVDNNSVFEN